MPPPDEEAPERNVRLILAHVAYGAALGAIYRGLEKRR
jgi:hypothetical protein